MTAKVRVIEVQVEGDTGFAGLSDLIGSLLTRSQETAAETIKAALPAPVAAPAPTPRAKPAAKPKVDPVIDEDEGDGDDSLPSPVLAARRFKPAAKPKVDPVIDEDEGDGDDSLPSPVLAARRFKLAKYLDANGPKTEKIAAETLSISTRGPACWSQVTRCDWFHVNADGVISLTSKGEEAARKAF